MILAAYGGYRYYLHQKYFPSTNDAYLQANVVHIAPRVNGIVKTIFIENHQRVKKGQLLFFIDPEPYQIALNQAIAELHNTIQQVHAAQADVDTARSLLLEREAERNNIFKSHHRIMTLVKQQLYPLAKGDEITSKLTVADAAVRAAKSQLKEAIEKLGHPGENNARIQEAKAAVAKAKLNLRYTHVSSPGNGYIVQFNLRKGQVVTAYQQLFSLIEDKDWWVSANFKETDLERIRPGQPVEITVDMYPNHHFQGTVDSISAGSGALFSLLPPENATGNWVKVTQRFPVRIKIHSQDQNYPLRMGASCTVTVNTTNASH